MTTRNQSITRQYRELSQEGYSHQHILEQLATSYFLTTRTIYAIVSGEYERRRELRLKRN